MFGLDPLNDDLGVGGQPTQWFGRGILMTQACDVQLAKSVQFVVAGVHEARKLVDDGILTASVIRDRIRRRVLIEIVGSSW
ncbi:MAG: hypothetical protein O3A00_24190 [Planctomycetota bacterium]|nr:hypothetical protein [Planctomycetota bacterium]